MMVFSNRTLSCLGRPSIFNFAVGLMALALFTSSAINSPTGAAVHLVSPSSIAPVTPVIDFNEPLNDNVVNPSYFFTGVPVYGDLRISFGSMFAGQDAGSMDNTLSSSVPGAPLSLDGPDVARQADFSNLSGGLRLGGADNGSIFTTPIAIQTSQPVSSIAFNLGHLDPPMPGSQFGHTMIQAYDDQGNILGTFQNDFGGFETIAIADEDGNNTISGISIFVEDEQMDWEGFTIDDVLVGGVEGEDEEEEEEEEEDIMPEPTTALVWGLLGMCMATRIRLRKHS